MLSNIKKLKFSIKNNIHQKNYANIENFPGLYVDMNANDVQSMIDQLTEIKTAITGKTHND